MIVAIKESGHTRAFVFGIEGGCWNLVHSYRIGVHVPEHRTDVPLVVKPRSQPHVIALRHKLAGHLTVRGRERLEEMKDALVAYGPGKQHEDEGEGEESAVKACARHARQKSSLLFILRFLAHE